MDLKIRKNKKSYTILDMYKPYILNSGLEVPYSTFKAVLDEFNRIVLEMLQKRSEGFKMPYGLGYV
jgi:hypothetical protein